MQLFEYLKSVYRSKDFLYNFTIGTSKSLYNQTKLGVLWGVINPLLTSFAFTIFGLILKASNDVFGHFMFTYTAVLPWILFRDGVLGITDSYVRNSSLISKVKFPRLIVPLATFSNKFFDFFVGLLILVSISIIKTHEINLSFLILPILILIIFFASVGMGLLFLVPSVYFRDINHLVKFMVPLSMFVSPILFRSNTIPASWQFWYSLNPLVGIIEGFRAVFYQEAIPWNYILTSFFVSIVIFMAGFIFFIKNEDSLNDEL